ncbi:protein TPX2 [Ziziphus jujuba]|uniref:Protein TPX2 n=1 Tax=Ziziphus jujuba TaxID=326968 RepID=A0ABM3IFZ9_ZIZJJ|nr:protein TPX2 [Ziziphus jujuba]
MAVAEESDSKTTTTTMMIDEIYEFSAPRFFDFVKGETDEECRKAEVWFDSDRTYAPSPFMPRIRTGRSFTVESLCDFSEAEQMQQQNSESASSDPKGTNTKEIEAEIKLIPDEMKEGSDAVETEKETTIREVSLDNCLNEDKGDSKCSRGFESALPGRVSLSNVRNEVTESKSVGQTAKEACTPISLMTSKKETSVTDSKKHQTAKKIASMVRNPSALKPKSHLHSSQAKKINPSSVKRETNVKNTAGALNLALENQAIKRQKLEGGRSRQILNVKPPQNLPHKSKLGLTGDSNNPSTNKTQKEDRKVYVREPAVPFVSMAEMMKKFQSSTRDLSLPNVNGFLSHTKPKLSLTRPKEPEFETSQRIRSVKVKSTAELEEEMMAKIPKFKARPLNKKILEAPSLPAIPRSQPQPPEFQEFHLETMARANNNADSASVTSTEFSRQNNQWKPHLTEPKTPLLHTSLRARPPKIKSSLEIEKEELENAPKFKARPLNKKIFESKGDLGIFCNAKKQVTIPQEFHFATNERIPPPAVVVDLFDKLSLKSEPCHDSQIPRKTIPNPFNLHTDERGAEKERKFVTEVMLKQWEEERARVPRANPYPYTTDYPVIPPKPEPKPCTRPEPFQLESLVRHEEEIQREMEERLRKEKEEEEMRIFRALPILKEDPIPVPEKVRKPLTQVQEFNHHTDHRAVDRAEFDQKVKEKEMMYKRYREETEAAKMLEEEKALKQMRRTMVPHARPVPKFNHPFCPQKSLKEITKAKSPNLRVLQRKEKRRMVVNGAISSAAAHMR